MLVHLNNAEAGTVFAGFCKSFLSRIATAMLRVDGTTRNKICTNRETIGLCHNASLQN